MVSAEKSFRIKQDDRFFSRLVSKETSLANSSSRVFYYGEASVAVPFMWESKPGTPKHSLSRTSLPPLTPPPSYHSNSNSNVKPRKSRAHIFSRIFAGSRKVHVSPSSSWLSSSSSLSSSSASLVYSSPSFSTIDKDEDAKGFRGCSPFGNIKACNFRNRRPWNFLVN